MWPMGCSSTEFSLRAVDVGQTFNSQNMNWNDCLGKVTLFGVMRIGIFNDRHVELVYSGIHKKLSKWKGSKGLWLRLWLYGNDDYSSSWVYIC